MDIKMHEYVESASDEFVKGYILLIGVILQALFYLTINKHTFIIIWTSPLSEPAMSD